MASIAKYVLMAAIIGGIVGCASQRGAQYVDPTEIIAGTPEQATMYDLESSAQQLMDKMLASPQFSANYNVVKAAKGGLPIAVIGNIEDKTKERVLERLDAVGDTIRAVLFSSGLFEVKDDAAAAAIKSRIIHGADGGLENGALVQTMGTQDSPDFIVLGDLRHFSDVGGYHTYRFRLAIHNLSTGKVVWEGIQANVKIGDWSSAADRGADKNTQLALEAFSAGNWSLGFSLAQGAEMNNAEIRQWLGKCYDPFVSTPGFRISKDFARARTHYRRAEELREGRKHR